jgi:hypothetical protein
MHLLYVGDWNSIFEGHREHSLSGIFSVDLGYIDTGVYIFEDCFALLSIACLLVEVKLLRQARLELVREPSIAKIWEYHASKVCGHLN